MEEEADCPGGAANNTVVNLILLESGEVDGEGVSVLSGERARHMLKVLKVAPGHRVRVGLIDGPAGHADVERVEDGAVALRCSFDAEVPPLPGVDLLLALPRPKVMRRLWAQLAAVGVGQIILTNAERVERDYFDSHILTSEVYRPLLIEGLQQARDTRVPSVSVHRRFRVLIEDDLDRLSGGGLRIVADPGAETPVSTVAGGVTAARILLAIGPEGGWNAFERGLLEAHGFIAAGLGPRTLRTDTACVALLTLVHDAARRRRQERES
jgi:RsmE family RNA methyltransferase